ncbi:MAG: DNA polymerase III subunit delta [Candidatus Falkowbacteria bacterium]|nr:DNA polymerase III subunit delta [Candidatus Falkowbacteria bacterium]
MIIFLYGEDSFRSRQKLKELQDKFFKEVDPTGGSIVSLAGEKITAGEISEAVRARSLFARKLMVVIENVFANKNEKELEKIYTYFKNESGKKVSAGDNVIIFWDETAGEKLGTNKLFKFLSEQKYAQNFRKLSNTETANWIKKEAQARGGKIKSPAVSLLASMFSGDLWQLNQELNKLINYKQAQFLSAGEATISEQDVELLCRGNIDENIFALTDAIGAKNKALALQLLEKEIEAGAAETYLLIMVIRQFKILLQVKEAVANGMSSRKIINQLHLHPFVVQKCLAQVNSFSLNLLKNIFSSLIEIDKKIKTGQTDFKTALSLLLLKT